MSVWNQPQWFHLLWPMLVLFLLLFRLVKQRHQQIDMLFSSALADALLERPSLQSKYLRLFVLALGSVFAVLAMMDPIAEQSQQIDVSDVEADVVIALDISKSMWAEDVSPNRLERAKYEIMEMMDAMPGYRFALVGFAGVATVLSPLTRDVSFLHSSLEQASPTSISRGGTNIGEALRKSMDVFVDSNNPRLLVLITDGEDHDSAVEDRVKEIETMGIPMITIGFGSEEGAPITITDSKTKARTQLRDRDGNVVLSRLDGELLRKMALETNGAYVPAGVGALDLDSIVKKHIQPIVRSNSTAETVVYTKQFMPYVLGSILCLVVYVLMRKRK